MGGEDVKMGGGEGVTVYCSIKIKFFISIRRFPSDRRRKDMEDEQED